MSIARPSSVALTGSLSRSSRWQRLGHVLAGVASWIALASLWIWQLKTYVPSNWLGAIELIFLLLAGWTCFSLGWVAWCRNIYRRRRRHRRTRPLIRAVDFGHDTLGRKIVASPGIGSVRGQLIVSVDASDVKHYQLASARRREQTPPADTLPTSPGANRETVAA